MLQRIRDRISGWIAGVIIALVASAFMLFGVEYYFDQNTSSQTVAATVNGVTITHEQVDQLFSQQQKQILAESGGQSLSDAMLKQLKAYALQSVITQTALLTTFEQEGFQVGLPQIKSMLMQAPEFQVQGKFSQEKMMETLYQLRVSPAQFFQRMQSQWIINQVTSGIAASAFALPNEVTQWYGLKNQKRAFGYCIVPMQLFLSKVAVTDQEIKDDYIANKSLYETPAKVSVAYIVLSPSDIAKKLTVTESDAKQYYQSHLANYQIPAHWQVAQITLPLAANASQAEIQKTQDQANAVATKFQENKDTGFTSSTLTLSATQVDPLLHKVLSGLSVNKVSSPFRTPSGFTILKVLKIMPAETHSFESVKNDVMQLLIRQHTNQILTQKSSQLSDLTYTNPDSLAIAAKALDLPIQISPMITKTGEKSGIFADPKILSSIFSDSVFQSGNNSSLIVLSDGSQVVLRVDKKQPSQPILLETVHDQIKQQLLQKQAAAEAGLAAYELQKKLNSGADPVALAKQQGLEWHSVGLASLDEKSTTPKPILDAAFSTPVSASASNKPMGTQAVLFNQHDYAVIAVTQLKNANATEASAAVNKQLGLQLSALWGQVLQRCLVNSVITQSHIDVKKPS